MSSEISKKEKVRLVPVVVILVIAILALSAYILFFKTKMVGGYDVRRADVDDAYFVKNLITQKVKLYDLDFDQTTALTYTKNGARLRSVYVTQAMVDEIRGFYLEALDDAKLAGDNTSVALSITGSADGEDVQVKNYFSEVTNVVDVAIDVDNELVAYFLDEIDARFPALTAFEAQVAQLTGKQYGGFIAYAYDMFDSYTYVGVPKVSKAFEVDITKAEHEALMAQIKNDNEEVIFSQDGQRLYVKTDGYLFMFAYATSEDGTALSIINAQAIPKE